LSVVVDGAPAERIRDDAGAERLREHEHIADPGAGVAPDAIGMHETRHREAVERLGRGDRMPAQDRSAGRERDIGPATQDLAHVVIRQVGGKPADGEGEERLAAHREHVGDRVGRRDAAVVIGVVDDRREHVDRLDDRLVGVQLHDGRVVQRVVADQEAIVAQGRAWHALQQLGEALCGHLAGTAPSCGALRQPRRLDLHPARSYMCRSSRPSRARSTTLALR
jgi:hypothetical protein